MLSETRYTEHLQVDCSRVAVQQYRMFGIHALLCIAAKKNKKHLKNVGPIRHCEPPHAHSPDVASGTVACSLRIDVHDDNDNA